MNSIEQSSAPKSQLSAGDRFAKCVATGLGVGLIAPVPGTVATALWGLPLAWGVAQLPGLTWQLAAIVVACLVGIPICTAAGRALGGQKDPRAIVWDEIAAMPIVFLLVPPDRWTVVLLGFLLFRFFDITKPPPARQLERLPDGLGVMVDDSVAAVYSGVALALGRWIDHAAGLGILTVVE